MFAQLDSMIVFLHVHLAAISRNIVQWSGFALAYIQPCDGSKKKRLFLALCYIACLSICLFFTFHMYKCCLMWPRVHLVELRPGEKHQCLTSQRAQRPVDRSGGDSIRRYNMLANTRGRSKCFSVVHRKLSHRASQ